MEIKPDPVKQLHQRRKRELNLIFKRFPEKVFENGLEIGAGDGYQSTLLTKYIKNLICTEYYQHKLPFQEIPNVSYLACDAEIIDTYFPHQKFDLIFSSSLLEHLPNRNSFLQKAHQLLKDNGLFINAVPNRFWKFSQISLHHFNYFILFLEKILPPKKISQKEPSFSIKNCNNPKNCDNPKYSSPSPSNLLRKILWPQPHGAYRNNLQEFICFGKKRWLNLFKKEGFQVVKIMKGPVSSGYSLGFKKTRRFMEKLGFCSTYVYILTKKNTTYLKYLR